MVNTEKFQKLFANKTIKVKMGPKRQDDRNPIEQCEAFVDCFDAFQTLLMELDADDRAEFIRGASESTNGVDLTMLEEGSEDDFIDAMAALS